MQSTEQIKAPRVSGAVCARAELLADIGGGAAMARQSEHARAGDAEGEPLDLIEEHLTFSPSLPPSFDYHQPYQGGRLIQNWAFPDGFKPDGELTPVLKVQPFASGGYEATIRLMDIEKIGRAMDGNRRFGKREAPAEQDYGCVQKAAARAKRKVRHLVKNMGATNLVTLTRRESEETGYWTPEEWAKAWDRLRRNLERALGHSFPYVGVLEAHKKGNFHLHLAWLGKVNLNLIRPLWWAICGGRGAGNVDSQYIKVRAGLERADRVAKYISKYTSKHFEDGSRFNKKRYWASRQTMQEAKRYVLRSKTVEGGLNEAFAFLGLKFENFMVRHPKHGLIADHVFYFPDGGGVWVNYIPDIHSSPDIPF